MAIFIRRTATIRLPFEVACMRFQERPVRWIPRQVGRGHESRTTVSGPPLPSQLDVSLRQVPQLRPGRAVLAMRWTAAQAAFLFPVLDADLELRMDAPAMSLLTLTGAYRPPFGEVGAVVNAPLMHRVAGRTIDGFVAAVAAAIEHGDREVVHGPVT